MEFQLSMKYAVALLIFVLQNLNVMEAHARPIQVNRKFVYVLITKLGYNVN